MSERLDLTGQRFGRLKAVNYAGTRGVRRRAKSLWQCICDCGGSVTVTAVRLRSGNTKSCGCLRRERYRTLALVHGDARQMTARRTSEYIAWNSMIQRCENSSHPNYKHYGGRGIKICERWRNSYPAFLADMGRRPTPQHSLDRLDNDGNYEQPNCRWATAQQQANNRRRRR